ncbi:MAG: sugar phosphate isomerase/epimerase [Clostridia bacterium]|nr:sugar phosphate isomerase/epimerase [Clostridia bacterium]
MKKRISLSTGALQNELGPYKMLEFAKESGLDAVDFELIGQTVESENSVYSKSDDEIFEYFDSIRKHAENCGIEIYQTHGRIKAYNYDEEFYELECRSFRCDCIATKALGAKYCVVHNVHLGLDAPDCDQRKINNRMFDDYMHHAKEHGIVIAMENLGDTCTPDGRFGVDFFGDKAEFLRSYNEVSSKPGNADHLCTCVDTGHINKATRFNTTPPPHEMILAMGNSVRCLHLNDNDSMTDQHLVPGAGNIDWQKVLCALRDIGYEGVYNMELDLRRFGNNVELIKQYTAFSVNVMKELLNKYL